MKMELDEARQFFADFYYGEHHLPGPIKPCGEGWKINHFGELASTDYNEMTRLILMAHKRAIRVTVSPLNFKHLSLRIHKRDPADESTLRGHPTIEQAIERHNGWMSERSSLYTIRPSVPEPAPATDPK